MRHRQGTAEAEAGQVVVTAGRIAIGRGAPQRTRGRPIDCHLSGLRDVVIQPAIVQACKQRN